MYMYVCVLLCELELTVSLVAVTEFNSLCIAMKLYRRESACRIDCTVVSVINIVPVVTAIGPSPL